MSVLELSTRSAGRNCFDCGDLATAYIQGRGFYCGGCVEEAPETRQELPEYGEEYRKGEPVDELEVVGEDGYTPAQRAGVTDTPAVRSEPLVELREPKEPDQMDLDGNKAVEGLAFERSVRTGEGVDVTAEEVLDGPWTLPGRGEVGDRCGVVAPNGFCNEGHVTFGRHDCGRRSCPRCWYTSWRKPRTVDVVSRLGAARYVEEENMRKRAVHVLVSPPEGSADGVTDFYAARSRAVTIAKECGVRGGFVVPHGYRVKDEIQDLIAAEREAGVFEGGDWKWVREADEPWYEFVEWSPHFHVIGLSEDVDSDPAPEGWVVHNIKRKRADGRVHHSLAPFYIGRETGYRDMAGVTGYLLSHATFETGSSRQVLTWFGSLHGSNFNPDPTNEDRELESPLTETEWAKIRAKARKVVGCWGDDEEEGEGGGEEEEETRECPHEGCEASWRPIYKAGDFLDQCGSRLSDEVYDRVKTAYQWAEGDKDPPPGMKRPKTQEQAQEAFAEMLDQ